MTVMVCTHPPKARYALPYPHGRYGIFLPVEQLCKVCLGEGEATQVDGAQCLRPIPARYAELAPSGVPAPPIIATEVTMIGL